MRRAGVEVWTRHQSLPFASSPPCTTQRAADLARVILRQAVGEPLDERDIKARCDACLARIDFSNETADGMAAQQDTIPARAVHRLHFKPDGAGSRTLWENAVVVDAELPVGAEHSCLAFFCSTWTLLQLMRCSQQHLERECVR